MSDQAPVGLRHLSSNFSVGIQAAGKAGMHLRFGAWLLTQTFLWVIWREKPIAEAKPDAPRDR